MKTTLEASLQFLARAARLSGLQENGENLSPISVCPCVDFLPQLSAPSLITLLFYSPPPHPVSHLPSSPERVILVLYKGMGLSGGDSLKTTASCILDFFVVVIVAEFRI